MPPADTPARPAATARKKKPAAKQPSPELRLAASELAIALRPLLRQVLEASDKFHAVVAGLCGDSYAVGAAVHKGVREAWDLLSWWREEAARISEQEGTTP